MQGIQWSGVDYWLTTIVLSAGADGYNAAKKFVGHAKDAVKRTPAPTAAK